MRTAIIAAELAALLLPSAMAQPAPKPFAIVEPVKDKVVPLVSLVERDTAARSALSADPDLALVASGYRDRLENAKATCAVAAACYVAAARLSEAETGAIEAALRRLASDNAAVRKFADGPLRASGIVPRADKASSADRLAAAWRNSAAMIANMMSVYGENGPTRTASIDAMRADPKSDSFGRTTRLITALMLERHKPGDVVIAAHADFALQLMVGDERDEAGRHEPMTAGENEAAWKRMAHVDWRKYPYTAILVPGQGPDDPDVRLDANGRIRTQLGLERWKAGKAPFIIVSGGYVHPNRTRYSEAIEMKRALMTEFGVPENAIIVDPHARHTTTNLRNAARLLFRYGAPMDRNYLVVSDEGQVGSIAADAFDARNLRETGIVPYAAKNRLAPYEIEIMPSLDALELNPTDPLDP